MRAMILAAGKGTRMRELTEHTPKPLLKAAGKSLIEYQLESLATAGVKEFVVNHAYLGEQIESYLGDGSRWNVAIRYSHEGEEPLETAGGIIKALPLLGDEPFLVVNADVWTDFDYSKLFGINLGQNAIVLVKNPDHNLKGDFALQNGLIMNNGPQRYTFSGIGLYHPDIFKPYITESKLSLAPILRNIADKNQLSGFLHIGKWIDVGTPERLEQLESFLITNQNSAS